MLETSYLVGAAAAALLILAVAAWAHLYSNPKLQRLDGRGGRRMDPGETASQLLVLAVSLSAVASGLAIVGWFAT